MEQQRLFPATEGCPERAPGRALQECCKGHGLRGAEKQRSKATVPWLLLSASQAPTSLAPSSPTATQRAQPAPRAAVKKSSTSTGTARHGVPEHSGTGTACTPGPLRTSTPRRGWSRSRGHGRASALGRAPHRAASEGASQGAMPAPAQACSCSCSWLPEQDPAAGGCLGWGGGHRPGTRAFSDATRSGESLHPWQMGSGQAGSPDDFPCRHERAQTP